jgi:hypothetical protein
MLDLETFGTKPGSVIRSIGAVQFDPRIGIGKEFYNNITEEDQIAYGATKDQSTVNWWESQSQESQDAFADNQVSLKMAVNSFANFFKDNGLQFVWAQGSAFDCTLWEHSCSFVGVNAPWKFWNTRDTRTAYQMTGFNTKSISRQGTYHNALDDAKHQVRCIYKCYMIMDGVTKR